MRQKVMSLEQAAGLIKKGDTITICASSGLLVPDKMIEAIGNRYKAEKAPADLTIVLPIAIGDSNGLTGLEHLAHEGMIKRLIGGSYVVGGRNADLKVNKMIFDNEVEAYNFPQGVLMHLLRDIAAKKPGVITKVGLGSFVDPDYGGGKLNERTVEDLVKHIEIEGEDYLFYKSFPIDVAVIRGTTADEFGNLSMEKEAAYLGVLHQAMAVHNNGGVVIAQVERVVQNGSLSPQMVKVPGMLVDAIVVAEKQQQCSLTDYDPALSGEVKTPLNELILPELQVSAKKIIARRAILELQEDWAVNVGFGTADTIPSTVLEEGLHGRYTFLIEQGQIGGVVVPGNRFGVMWNAMAFLDSPNMFDLLDGGGFHATCLASAKIDSNGSVVVHRLPNMLPGCGGFLNIIENVERIIFCGTFTSGGLKISAEDGFLKVLNEGSIKKFVSSIDAPTYNAERGLQKNQEVMYITERAVFKLTSDGLELTEVAPGIDIQRDILPYMDFEPIIKTPKTMDQRIFSKDKHLQSIILEKEKNLTK
ncbi:CoA-transferase [Shouchella clausii]|uniref:acyl CoA:acetate/3-ketoacid CoA transferase n=1 Tax=Shouchella clausii TaxID=79880 RepID=UPI0039838945